MDVTEHELLTQEIRRREAYLAEAQRLSHTGSFGWKPESGEIVWSDETYRIFEYDSTLKPTLDLAMQRIHPQDRALVQQVIDRASQTGTGFEHESRLLLADGRAKHLHAIAHAVQNASGDREFIGAVTDITERKISEEKIRRLVETDILGIFIANVEGEITEANQAFPQMYVASTDIDERKRAEEKLQQENVALREEVDKASMFEEIVGASAPLKGVLTRVSKVAASDSTVLIAGETGTGKELVARAIHRRSGRSARPFVSVNCAAVPRELIASELFGHEKGAFTGATQRRLGRFELAHRGTIFLDEVGELPMETQLALLRVLQEREFERVGGSAAIRVDVRVIAATNRDLPAAIQAGTFRSDLFYRLNVFPITVPPLRERADDIPLLVEYFIDRYARKAGKTIRRVNKRTLDRLQSYLWPGNVRELQNVIERSVIVCDTDEFTVDESWLSAGPAVERKLALSSTLAGHEKTIIEDALRASGGRVFGPAGAAARLGIARSTLESKIRALRIDKSRFRGRPAKQ